MNLLSFKSFLIGAMLSTFNGITYFIYFLSFKASYMLYVWFAIFDILSIFARFLTLPLFSSLFLCYDILYIMSWLEKPR